MEPVTRKEHFLARIAGKPHDESLFPITREEFFLDDIAESGGGGGGGGLFIVTVTTSGSTLVADKTVADIHHALASGKIPVAIEARDENGFTAHSAYYFVDSTSASATFRRMSCSSSGVYGTDIHINPVGVEKIASAYSPGK